MTTDNGLVRQGDSALTFTDDQRQMIRDTYANGASDGEFAVLMEIARARRLNPLMKHIHFVKRWTPRGDVWSAQASIDGMRVIAERTGRYAGQDEPEFVEAPDGTLIACKVRVYRTDWSRAAVGVAYWAEYVQTTRDKQTGKTRPTEMWAKMPHVMLGKCAESIALRKAFPEDIGGIYSEDEMGQSENDRQRHDASDHAEPVAPKAPALPPSTPSALPRDHGAPPSRAAAERPSPDAEAPIVEAPPVALPLSDRDLRAMLAEITSATDLAALRAAWKGMADDEKRGTEEQRAALLDAATKRKAVFAEEARLREERKAAADAEPPNDDGPPKPPRGPRKPRTPVATPDATGGGAEGADGPVDAPGARSSSGHPMTTRAERRAHLATLPLAETVRLSWRHRAAMPPPHYREDCALRVCALTRGFGVEDALAYLDAAPLRVVAPQPKTRAA